MQRLFTAAALGLALQTAPAALAADHFYDAMTLAIDHFNAAHTKDLRSWDAEHRFMYDALGAVDAQVPAVAGISLLGRVDYDTNDPFRNLAVSLYLSQGGSAEEQELARTLGARAREIAAGCPYNKVTRTEETDFGTPSQTVRITETYTLDHSAGRECADQAVTQALVAAGISQIVVDTEDRSWGDSFSLTFSQGSNTWRDMAYVKAQLLQIPAVKDVAERLEVLDTHGNTMIGRSQHISLEGTSGAASFDEPFTLVYTLGWGDCPAGCISRHTWKVKVTPTQGQEGYAFTAAVISESGDPVPPRPLP